MLSLSLSFLTSISNAEYTSKFFLEDIKFKTPTPTIPNVNSTNCIFNTDNGIFAIKNISSSNSINEIGFNMNINDAIIFYNNTLIGRYTSTINFPTGLSLGDEVPDINYNPLGYGLYKICADNFLIYSEVDMTTGQPYTYDEISIPAGSLGLMINNGNVTAGFMEYDPLNHPGEQNAGTPINTSNGNRMMLLFDYNNGYPLAIFYVVKNQEKLNEQLIDSGTTQAWWNQYSKVTFSNNDNSISFDIDMSNNGGIANFIYNTNNIDKHDYDLIMGNPNIITNMKFRKRQ